MDGPYEVPYIYWAEPQPRKETIGRLGLLSVMPVPIAVVVWPTVIQHVELHVAIAVGI